MANINTPPYSADDWAARRAYIYSPSFFDDIVKELGKEVVGETRALEVMLLCTSGRLVQNASPTSYHLLVNDESGAGKDHLCKSVGKLYVAEATFIKRTRISPKVLDYWHAKKDEDWTWNGKILYLEDVSYEILNCEVMRTFLSSGSKVTILADQGVRELEVKGKPIVIFTTATINPKFEMLRRMNILNLDTTVNQTKEIAKRKCLLAKDGKDEEIDPVLVVALNSLHPVKAKIPYADRIAKWIDGLPDDNIKVMFRTQISTFLDYVKAITALYQRQRETDELGFLQATGQDYEIAKRVFEKMVSNPLLVPLTKQQRTVIDIIKELSGSTEDFVKITEIIDRITFWEQRWSYKQLNKLVDMGILLKDKSHRDRSEEQYPISDKPVTTLKINKVAEMKIPDFDSLLQN